MADNAKRKAEEEDLPDAKRQAVEGEEEAEEEPAEELEEVDEGEEEEDEEGDEEGDEDEEDGDEEDDEEEEEEEDEEEKFDMEDFNDVEGFTPEQLEKFSQAFNDFQDMAEEQAGDGGVVLMASDPTTLRPVPMSVDDFKKQMAYCFLTTVGEEAKQTIEEQVVISLTNSDDEEEPDPDQVANAQIETFSSVLKELKENPKPNEAWEIAVVLTHMFLEDQPTMMFESGDYAEGCCKLLSALADIWKDLLSKSDEDLGFKGDARERVKSIIKLLMENLAKDEYAKGAYKGKFDVPL